MAKKRKKKSSKKSTPARKPERRAKIEARTENQQKLIDSILSNQITFTAGPAGTGKTFLSIASAIKLLKDKKSNYDRIIITRPQIATKKMPYLPGTEAEKGAPFIRPLKDTLRKILIASEVDSLIASQRIEAMTFEYMRGMSIDNSIVILDEAQNVDKDEMLMFLTRIGEDTKFIITGDLDQTDLRKEVNSGLAVSVEMLTNLNDIGIVELGIEDIVRNPLIKNIIRRFTFYNRLEREQPQIKNPDPVTFLDPLSKRLEEFEDEDDYDDFEYQSDPEVEPYMLKD